jgi:hypothetical protein
MKQDLNGKTSHELVTAPTKREDYATPEADDYG